MTDKLSQINVDLQLASTKKIKSLIEQFQEVVQERESNSTEEHAKKTDELLDHIDSELSGPAVATEDLNDLFPELSLEHLEIYQAYLGRVGVPESLNDKHQEILTKVIDALKSHPLAGASRSGDRKGNEHGSSLLQKVPLGRRRQTCVMLLLNLLTGPILIFLACALFMMYFPYSPYIAALYIGLCTYDNFTRGFPAPNRVSQKWKRNGMYALFRDYFPIRLVKADQKATYNEKDNFLFAYHPHGVQSAGALAIGTGVCGFNELFPGLKAHVQTLSINFRIPFYRETLIMLGAGDASRETLKNTLTPKSPGNSVVLVTGGALESMYSAPHVSKVVLKSRAGFVKIAMQTGANLVPVWGFGENDLYDNLAAGSPTIIKWQRKIQRMISFAPLIVAGRGVFSYSGGLLPHRRPISVVIGKPIPVGAPNPNPTSEQINEVHTKYKQAVVELFNKYRDVYDPKAEDIEFI